MRIFCLLVFFCFFSTLYAQQLGEPMPSEQNVNAQISQIDQQINDLQNRLNVLQQQQQFAVQESQNLEFTDYLGSRSRIEQANQINGQIQVVEQQISQLQQQKAQLQLYQGE